MSWLQDQVANRLRCKFYMQLPATTKWYHPPEARLVMELLTPIHVIGLTPTMAVVDGLAIPSCEGQRAKEHAVDCAIENVYGRRQEEAHLSESYSLAANTAGIYTVTERCPDHEKFRTSFLSVPTVPVADSRMQLMNFLPKVKGSYRKFMFGERKQPRPLGIPMDLIQCRFAVEATLSEFCEPEYNGTWENTLDERRQSLRQCLIGIGMYHAESAVLMNVSKRFYKKPAPENAVTLGDLCFLSQMLKDWKVARIVYPALSRHAASSNLTLPTSFYLAETLKRTVGVESFRRYCRIRKLLTTAFNSEIEAKWLEIATEVGARWKTG